MKIVKNLDEAYKYLEATIIKSLQTLGEKVKTQLKIDIKQKWYGRAGYSPSDTATSYYKRTFQLLDSVELSLVKKTSNTYSCRVYFDYSKITPEYRKFEFPAHMSVVDQSAFVQELVWLIVGDDANPSKIYGWESTNILSDLIEYVKQDKWILYIFELELKKAGFTVVTL